MKFLMELLAKNGVHLSSSMVMLIIVCALIFLLVYVAFAAAKKLVPMYILNKRYAVYKNMTPEFRKFLNDIEPKMNKQKTSKDIAKEVIKEKMDNLTGGRFMIEYTYTGGKHEVVTVNKYPKYDWRIIHAGIYNLIDPMGSSHNGMSSMVESMFSWIPIFGDSISRMFFQNKDAEKKAKKIGQAQDLHFCIAPFENEFKHLFKGEQWKS